MCFRMSWITGSFFVLLVILFCPPGEATVECYICSTQDNENECLYPKWYDLPVFHCDQTALEQTREIARKIHRSYDKIFEVDTHAMARQLDLVCLKVVTKLGTKSYTFRGCQLAEQTNTGICHKLRIADTDFMKISNCSRCNTDACNSAPRSVSKIVFNIIVSVLIPLLVVIL